MAKKTTGNRNHPPNPHDRPTGRLTAELKAAILEQVDMGRTRADVARQYGVHPVSISRWLKARELARNSGDPTGKSGLDARSTRPIDAVSPVPPQHRELVIDLKAQHPEMGPAQIRNQLRRFHGISLSHKTIGKILKDAGFKLETRVPDLEEASVERFEMSRPNELWTMDIKSFYVHDLKLYLIDILDDYSRFVVGHGLLKESSADQAISTLRKAISRHGKPERVLTDRGGEFHTWGGDSAFTAFLEGECIAHSLARPHHPQTCGKIEALHATLEKELLGVVRFDSFSHARREVSKYFERYNFERTHMGIGGVTPADRYAGRVETVLSGIEGRTGAIDRPQSPSRLPGERAVVLQIALFGGKLELWFAGKRVELG